MVVSTSIFICVPKINFTIHFLILHFKESFSILAHNSTTRICQIWAGSEISVTILIFILDYFQEKTNDKIFQENPQKHKKVLGHFGLFLPIWAKMNFPGKKRALSVFKYSSCLLLCKKSGITNEPLLRKMPELANRQTNRWTD